MVVAVVIFRSVSALSSELFKLKSENCMNNKLKMKCKDNQYLAFPDNFSSSVLKRTKAFRLF